MTKVKIEVELKPNQFFCSKCETIHDKVPYAIAQAAMGNDLIFMCSCGNEIDLPADES